MKKNEISFWGNTEVYLYNSTIPPTCQYLYLNILNSLEMESYINSKINKRHLLISCSAQIVTISLSSHLQPTNLFKRPLIQVYVHIKLPRCAYTKISF